MATNVTPGYTPTGTYLDRDLPSADQTTINNFKAQYEASKAKGDQAGMSAAHAGAEAIRAQYGYSGGVDGSEYIPLMNGNMNTGGTRLPSYEAQIDAANKLYDAAMQKHLSALQSAYDNSKMNMEAYKEKLPQIYQAQANTISANAEKEKANFNEMAAYQGMNAGTGSQAKLALTNAEQSAMTDVRVAEANAMKDAEHELSALYVNYQNAITEAVANNEYERAAALLEEYQKAAESVVETAYRQALLDLQSQDQAFSQQLAMQELQQSTTDSAYRKNRENAETLAKYGDFSGYKNLGYSDDAIAQMLAVWKLANPDLAWALG